jgi:hypothetical protein
VGCITRWACALLKNTRLFLAGDYLEGFLLFSFLSSLFFSAPMETRITSPFGGSSF